MNGSPKRAWRTGRYKKQRVTSGLFFVLAQEAVCFLNFMLVIYFNS
jgi:hypothetical protein